MLPCQGFLLAAERRQADPRLGRKAVDPFTLPWAATACGIGQFFVAVCLGGGGRSTALGQYERRCSSISCGRIIFVDGQVAGCDGRAIGHVYIARLGRAIKYVEFRIPVRPIQGDVREERERCKPTARSLTLQTSRHTTHSGNAFADDEDRSSRRRC